jgi:hypothetical protein
VTRRRCHLADGTVAGAQVAQFCFSPTLAMPPDTGNMISFFRSGTKSMPVPQQSERNDGPENIFYPKTQYIFRL